jgi:hypothetical protein
MRFSKVFLRVAVFAALVFIAIVWKLRFSQPHQNGTSVVLSDSASKGGNISPASHDLKDGDELLYSVRVSQEAAFTSSATLATRSAQPDDGLEAIVQKIELSGRWQLTVYGDLEGCKWIGTRFVGVSDPSTKTATPFPAGELEKEIFFSIDSLGGIRRLYFPPDIAPVAIGFWQSWLESAILPLPSSPTENWSADYTGIMGKYRAEHRMISKRVVSRRKVEFLSLQHETTLNTRAVGSQRVKEVDDTQTFTFHASRNIEIKGEGRSKMTIDSGLLGSITARQEFEFELLGDSNSGVALREQLLARYRVTSLDDVIRSLQARGPQEMLAPVLTASTATTGSVDDLVDRFRRLGSAQKSERGVLFASLALLLRSNPDRIADIEAALERSRGDEKTVGWLASALASANDPAAQNLLIKLLQSSDGSFSRAALKAAAFVPHPSQPLAEAVLQTFTQGDVSTRAGQLGMMVAGAYLPRVTDPELKTRIFNTLYQTGSMLQSATELPSYFTALANTQSPSAIAAITEKAKALDSIQVWNDAVGALQHMRIEPARDYLLKLVSHETLPAELRQPVVVSLSRQELPHSPGVRDIMMKEAVNYSNDWLTRKSALSYFKETHVQDSADLLRLFHEVATRDPSREVRDFANHTLSNLRANQAN